MSNAQFDGGHQLRWFPQGSVYGVLNVNTGPVVMAVLNPAAIGIIRIDYASVVLDYHVSDDNASASIGLYVGGDTYPLVTCAGLPVTYTIGPLATVSPYTQERAGTQLSNPLYLTGTDIVTAQLLGHGADGSSSIAYGILSYSAAWPT
jgi:hypothetical protein